MTLTPLPLASELRHVLPAMAVRSVDYGGFKGKEMKIEIKKYERFVLWAWGGILIMIVVLFVKNALAH